MVMYFKMILNGMVPIISLMILFVKLYILQPGIMYGYMILSLLQAVIVWPMVCILILWERKYMLPTPPSRGHGIILLIFWTGLFALENLMFLNLKDPDWFFQLKTFKDIVLFSMFTARYVVIGSIFFLGLKAPGIPSVRNSDSFTRLHPDGDEGNSQSSSQGSPFRNIWSKIKMLAPFMWPSKSIKLQLHVIISVGLLIMGRLTNIYVPLYSKKIGKSVEITKPFSI